MFSDKCNVIKIETKGVIKKFGEAVARSGKKKISPITG